MPQSSSSSQLHSTPDSSHKFTSPQSLHTSSDETQSTSPESLKHLLSKYNSFLNHFQSDQSPQKVPSEKNSELDANPQDHINEIYQHINPSLISSLIQNMDTKASNAGMNASSRSTNSNNSLQEDNEYLSDLEHQLRAVRQKLLELQHRSGSELRDHDDNQSESIDAIQKWINNNEDKQQYSPNQLLKLTSDSKLNDTINTPIETGFIAAPDDQGIPENSGYASDDEADIGSNARSQHNAHREHRHKRHEENQDVDSSSTKWSTMSNPPSTRRSSPGSIAPSQKFKSPGTEMPDESARTVSLTPSDTPLTPKSVAWSTKTNPAKSVHPASGSDITSVLSGPSQPSRKRPSSDEWSATSLSMNRLSGRPSISERPPRHARIHNPGRIADPCSQKASPQNSLHVNLSAQGSIQEENMNTLAEDDIEELQPETIPSPIEEDKALRSEHDSISTRSLPSHREASPTLHVISSRGEHQHFHNTGSSSSLHSTLMEHVPQIAGRMKIYTPSHTYRVHFAEDKHASLSNFISNEDISSRRCLTYEDEEGDWITIRNKEEWEEAIRCWSADNKKRLFRVRIMEDED
uniref:PB1 domain-containing protein n=1 Tax=Percolomonas cosmopolitus TaxID=63605 RepID=A0A7S1PIK1_9EUKA|mmetsp:Transcript_4386/g.16531  ORF Transcript_4386/g.16531 Transcript_4386/m.16531 type:complete len:578 (+) Transcript_4386:58-1791(+)|eukprot:CAMPEP_0117447280 /NCGR_PEP_ID=MMETSP0759-20121206/6788_1 /TAXON_ID=63605 /ORGANISM="Percolomonas cosmopolitus, Strain WS" /LENGTH=577 /DNA_ID=CAMNT_0005239599 /DNA_START=45 /DNA_END=1778 /DNA_ORIENTATION=-